MPDNRRHADTFGCAPGFEGGHYIGFNCEFYLRHRVWHGLPRDLGRGFAANEEFRVFEPVRFPFERVTPGMVQDPVHHRRRKHGVAHHFHPLGYLLVRCEYYGAFLIGIADEAEEAVGLDIKNFGYSRLS